MKHVWVIWLGFIFSSAQETIPFKADDEFEVKLDYQFKQRPANDPNHVDLAETRLEHSKRTRSTGPLPYLFLRVNLLKINPDESRVKIQHNKDFQILNKKLKPGMVLELDMGFTDDLKDHTAPYEYIITFFSDDKDPVRKIVILIDDDGNFLINGEKRGKL